MIQIRQNPTISPNKFHDILRHFQTFGPLSPVGHPRLPTLVVDLELTDRTPYLPPPNSKMTTHFDLPKVGPFSSVSTQSPEFHTISSNIPETKKHVQGHPVKPPTTLRFDFVCLKDVSKLLVTILGSSQNVNKSQMYSTNLAKHVISWRRVSMT